MWLAKFFQRSASASQTIAWAVDVARNCHASVAQRLDQSIYRMSLTEARGYIRARAATVVDLETRRLHERTGCHPQLALAVAQRAKEEVIRMAMGDLLKATRQSAQMRRAA